jgi:hypothetical protein
MFVDVRLSRPAKGEEDRMFLHETLFVVFSTLALFSYGIFKLNGINVLKSGGEKALEGLFWPVVITWGFFLYALVHTSFVRFRRMS